MSTKTIDLSKPLFDSDGNLHTLVASNGIEIVTKISFVYVIWNAKTGAAMKDGAEGIYLGNEPMSVEELARRTTEAEIAWAKLQERAAGDRVALAAVIDMAREHVQDIDSGLEDGTYDPAENTDIEDKRVALAHSEAMYLRMFGHPAKGVNHG